MKNKALKYRDMKYRRKELKLHLQNQELVLRNSYHEFRESLNPPNIRNQVLNSLLNDPAIIVKAGFILFSILKWRKKHKTSK